MKCSTRVVTAVVRAFCVIGTTGLSLVACGADDDHSDATLVVSVAGEDAATNGFAFPRAAPGDLAFVDGWDVRFDRILVTVDAIVLTENPDANPTDQEQTGAIVQRAKGPWAVDVTKAGVARDLTPLSLSPRALRPLAGEHGEGEGPNPNAQPLVRFTSLAGGKAFDTSARYGFGFDLVTATADAKRTNLDANAEADYVEMTQKGLSVLYVGTATFKGTDCKSSDAAYTGFDALPKSVRFRFGFKTPTTYVNCQNTDLKGKPFDGEEAQRGVQLSATASTFAQITLHVDHPFWSTVDHDAAEPFFDQMAAMANADGVVSLDDLAQIDPTNVKDKAGAAMPWRSCLADKPPKEGTRKFDTGSVPVSPQGDPQTSLRHYGEFVSYVQSAQGHLNADGLCAVQRRYAAPR